MHVSDGMDESNMARLADNGFFGGTSRNELGGHTTS